MSNLTFDFDIDVHVNKEDVNRAIQKCKRGPSP
ncbi:hypothetical protein J2Z64_001512 [Oceanobacillus polygoni]|uniref:Uncharacterized protein n=1 Tax=Oceanobacillus polygoni TaxID=1235259 RepID=A0A9X1CEQ6_9BACI|nr:hypothetical protein [Oceanobacillus polygoni]